jgi:CRP-like cAMP-binding protein
MSLEAEYRNYLLASLPPEVLQQVAPHLRRVSLPFRAVPYRPDDPIDAVHFVESGYVSLIVMLADGDAVEVGVIGREGMAGLPLLFGVDRARLEFLVQSPVTAWRMEAAAFQHCVGTLPQFRAVLLRYAMAYQMQITYCAACNSRHLIEQRLARWLLMAHDRVSGDEFPLTHEFLSMMLGVRRASISIAAQIFQRAGLIRYEFGQMRIVDRPGLVAVACECHGMIRREYDRLLPAPSKPG